MENPRISFTIGMPRSQLRLFKPASTTMRSPSVLLNTDVITVGLHHTQQTAGRRPRLALPPSDPPRWFFLWDGLSCFSAGPEATGPTAQSTSHGVRWCPFPNPAELALHRLGNEAELGPQPFHCRIVLLVNRRTASAGESITGFAKENKLATIVGTKTAGQVLGGARFKIGETRNRRIEWGGSSLMDGNRRPCCWPGCAHR
jgi:hypothetical protein